MKKQTKLLMLAIVAVISAQLNSAFGQSTILGNTLTGATPPEPLQFLGSDNGYDAVFKVNNTDRMRIIQNGNVSIGTIGFTPTYKLDVEVGDINVNTYTDGYRIDSKYVLRHNGDTTSILVGVGAGSANAAVASTFIGHQAGRANTTGANNTFVGAYAGDSNTTGKFNVIVGELAGSRQIDSSDYNTFVGYRAGITNKKGITNTFIRQSAGNGNIRGSDNTYVGLSARGTGANASKLKNASALGANATISCDSCMVLGNAVKVGIGTTTPAYKPDVNGTIAANKILIVDDNTTQDLLALITQLQDEVNELKHQLMAEK